MSTTREMCFGLSEKFDEITGLVTLGSKAVEAVQHKMTSHSTAVSVSYLMYDTYTYNRVPVLVIRSGSGTQW